jgi:hypothetical protein
VTSRGSFQYNSYSRRPAKVSAFLHDARSSNVLQASQRQGIPRNSAYNIYKAWRAAGSPHPDEYTLPRKRRRSLIGDSGDDQAAELVIEALNNRRLLTDSSIADAILSVRQAQYAKAVHTRAHPSQALPVNVGHSAVTRLKRKYKLATGTPSYKAQSSHDLNSVMQDWRQRFVTESAQYPRHLIINGDQTQIPTDVPRRQVLRHIGQQPLVNGDPCSHRTVTVMATVTLTGVKLPLYALTSGRTDRSHCKFTKHDDLVLALSGKNSLPWFTNEAIINWIHLIIAPYTNNQPSLLLLDAASIHRHENVVRYCQLHNINLLPIPPLTTWKLQPLDVGVFGSCKAALPPRCSLFEDSQFYALKPAAKLAYKLEAFYQQFAKTKANQIRQAWTAATGV